jgi:hypothetical protein
VRGVSRAGGWARERAGGARRGGCWRRRGPGDRAPGAAGAARGERAVRALSRQSHREADVAAVLRAGTGSCRGRIWRGGRGRSGRLAVGGSDETPFAQRFWPDGTPRLSAYEYQGLLQSPCHADGQGRARLQPLSRHARGAIRTCRCAPVARELGGVRRVSRAGSAEHGGHGEAVDCQGCHMPRITYGLLEGMISHRIASPDPGAWVGRHDQPDACTQCHVDRSRTWAAEQLPRLGFNYLAEGGARARRRRRGGPRGCCSICSAGIRCSGCWRRTR